MLATKRLLGKLKARLAFTQAKAETTFQDLLQQRTATDELISHLQARLGQLRSRTRRLTIFWGHSYTGLRDVFEQGCEQHLSELERLRADLDLAMQGAGDLKGRKLRDVRTHVEALWSQTEELRRQIEEREQFWNAEAEWALNLLGERSASIWPPEPARSDEASSPPSHLAQTYAELPRMAA
jgi:hypothetical protein